MNSKKALQIMVIPLLFSFIFPSIISAQSWYFTQPDSENILGMNYGGGRPENAGGKPERDNQIDKSLRQSNFEELKAQRELSREERKTAIEELRAEKAEDRCARIEANIQRRIDFYQNGETTHRDRYQGIARGMSNLIEALTKKGVDTSAAAGSVAELQTMISELNALHDQLKIDLVTAKSVACDKDDQKGNKQFKDIAVSTKDQLSEIRTAIRDIHEFIRTELVSSIKGLKENGPKEKEDKETRGSDDSEEPKETEETEEPEVEIEPPEDKN